MKVTLITGASSGIGEAIARKLAAKNQSLLLVARNEEKLQKLCRELSSLWKIQAQYIVCDLVQPDAPEKLYSETKKRGLEVEVLINNAGIGSGGEFAKLNLQSELNMMQLNMQATVALTHLFMQDMIQNKRGSIVNVASMIAFMPVPYMMVYGATKAFIKSFTEALTEECIPHHIHVMLLYPGLTQTNFIHAADLNNSSGNALTAGAPTQTAEEVAEEAVKGLLAKKTKVISGSKNRFFAKLLAFIPKTTLAKSTGKTYRKRMKIY